MIGITEGAAYLTNRFVDNHHQLQLIKCDVKIIRFNCKTKSSSNLLGDVEGVGKSSSTTAADI